MGITIEGWVEVTLDEKLKPENKSSWIGLIYLLPLIDVSDKGSISLFEIGWPGPTIEPIAKGKG